MAWLKSEQSLVGHPKTKRAARALSVSIPTVIGHLHCLWYWALDYAQDGSLSRYESWEIAEAALYPGDPDTFIEALRDCGKDRAGFIEETEDGLAIHDWDEYGGLLIEHREFLSERAKRKRNLYSDATLTRAVRARDGDLCRYCGQAVNWSDRKGATGGTYDHVDPEGDNTPDNVVVACRSCNSRKNRRLPEDAGLILRPVGNLPEIYPCSAKSREEESRQDQSRLDEKESREEDGAGGLLALALRELPVSQSTEDDYRRTLTRHQARLPRGQIERIIYELAEFKPKKPRDKLHLTLNQWLAKEEPTKGGERERVAAVGGRSENGEW